MCIRCGGGDHLHDRCKAEAKDVKWGIDWKMRRKSRKRWRRAAKKRQGAGTETTVEVLEETEDDRTVNDISPTVLKMSQSEMKASVCALAASDGMRRESRGEGGSAAGNKGNTDAAGWARMNNRLKEVDDLKGDGPPARGLSFDAHLKEVDDSRVKEQGARIAEEISRATSMRLLPERETS